MQTMDAKRWGLIALAVVAGACSDSSGPKKISQTKDAECGAFGCEESDGSGGVVGDMGTGGGDTGTGSECTSDTSCPDDQYCRRADPNDLTGECARGCRNDDSCPDGQICDTDTRTCGGCKTDVACAEGEYCDVATNACASGCRTEPNSCPEGETCNPDDRTCASSQVCCNGVDNSTCSLVQDAAECQGGVTVAAVTSCDPNPCGPLCANDGECDAARYCSDNGFCVPGCRVDDPNACPPGEFCDPDKHSCQPNDGCQTDLDCAEGEACDVASGACVPDGCGECDPGTVCNEDTNMCVPGCASDMDCPDGAYCDAVGFFCRDFCGDSEDCQPDEFCDLDANPDGGECVVGCRDDEVDPPNDTPANATAIQIVGNRGEVRGALLCGGNPDVYAVPLLQGYRVQVTLEYDAGIGDIELRLIDRDQVTELASVVDLGSPKRIQYPGAGGGVRVPDDYFVEVRSDDQVSQSYTLRIVVIDSINDACFPDLSEDANGGRGFDNQDSAQPIAWDGRGDELFCFNGSVCNGDEDWFTFPGSDVNAGFSLELSVDGLVEGEAVVETYSAGRVRLGLGDPNFATGAGVVTPQGRTLYNIEVARDSVALSDEPWFIRLRGETNNTVLDNYDLCVRLLQPGVACREDAAEPNDQINAVGPQANLDAVMGVTANGRLRRGEELEIPVDFALCAQETDLFRFTADDGDLIEVHAVSDALAGDAIVEVIGAQDGNLRGNAGSITAIGGSDPAVFNGAQPGEYFVRVRAVGAGSADPYRIRIRIDPSAMCIADRAEVGPGSMRNDTPGTAVDLMALPGQATRFEYDNGLVCNVPDNVGDRDWYRFTVNEPGSRICVATNAFNPDAGNLDLQFYFSAPLNPLDEVPCQADITCRQAGAPGVCLQGAQRFCGCRTDNDCDADGDRVLEENEGFCIADRCRIASQISAHNGSPEALDVQKEIVDAGEYFVLVDGADSTEENSYNLAVTVTPPSDECLPDWREQENDNNDIAFATDLGAGEAAVCDAWLCADRANDNDERLLGDNYQLLVPAGEDRTVHLAYSRFSDGAALLTYLPLDIEGMVLEDFAGENPNQNLQANSECLVIEGGATDTNVIILVTGDIALNDGDKRIDYTLWVRPTDIARDGANGKCEEFGPLVNVWNVETP
jgi:hypothetical protein